MKRLAVAAPLAILVTFGLYFTMQYMVAMRVGELNPAPSGKVVGFVRLRRETTPEPEAPELPQRPPELDTPPPVTQSADNPDTSGELSGGLTAVAPQGAVVPQLASGAQLGIAVGDTDAVPLLRVEPEYPPAALRDGIEGWVRLRFSIGRSGQVKNVVVVDSKPAVVFDEAALRAVRKWKYQPKTVDGQQVERHGLLVRLTFEVDKR